MVYLENRQVGTTPRGRTLLHKGRTVDSVHWQIQGAFTGAPSPSKAKLALFAPPQKKKTESLLLVLEVVTPKSFLLPALNRNFR